jgi:hypothetical protein
VQGVKQACRTTLGVPEDAIFAVSHIFMSCKPHKGQITCVDGSSGSFNAGPATLVKLRPGCTAKSHTHAVTAPKDISQTIPSIVAMWTEGPVLLLQDIDLDFWAELVAQPNISPLILEDMAEVAAWLKSWTTEERFKTTMMVHTGLILMMFEVLLIVAAISFTCWWKRTAIKRILLNNHHAQHKKKQASTAYAWMTEAAGNRLKMTQEALGFRPLEQRGGQAQAVRGHLQHCQHRSPLHRKRGGQPGLSQCQGQSNSILRTWYGENC